MRTRFTLTICGLTLLTAGPGYAQSGPEGQSCGGLLCDMGVFGHKTPPPPAPPPVIAPAPPAPPAEAQAAASPDPAPKPKVRVAHRKAPLKIKNLAKAATPNPSSAPVAAAAAPAAPSTPSRSAPLLFQTVDPRL